MIIVQHTDEIWPQNPLLRNDPHERAPARLWVNFSDDKVQSTDIILRYIKITVKPDLICLTFSTPLVPIN